MKKAILMKFLAILMTSLTVFVVMGGAAAYAYSQTAPGDSTDLTITPPNPEFGVSSEEPVSSENPEIQEVEPLQLNIPEITTALILGVDYDEYLTDVIILAVYDATTGNLDLISIPRDTRVVVDSELKAAYSEIGKSVPSAMKINAIHSYAGKTNGVEFIRNYLNGLFDIEIDYYCKVNMEGFRNIIDGVGGIMLDVPQRLYHYDERAATHIDVAKGLQLLDGQTALGVVRYRSYPQGDLARIDMQHVFLQALFEQVVTKETIMANPMTFVSTLIGYVNTDIGLDDISDYLPVLETFNPDKITFYTAEGYADDTSYGASYYIIDKSAAATMINDITKANRNPAPETDVAEDTNDIDTTSSPNAGN